MKGLFRSVFYPPSSCHGIAGGVLIGPAVTRSVKAIHHLTNLPSETSSRSAKRRRTETSTSETTAVQNVGALRTPLDDSSTAPTVLGKNDAILGNLQARIANSAGALSAHGNGEALLLTNTCADQNKSPPAISLSSEERMVYYKLSS